MSDRLVEIEALREAAGIPTPLCVESFPDDYGGVWELHLESDARTTGRDYAEAFTAESAAYLAALLNNADWLLARIHELEAQAARYARVIAVAERVVKWHSLITLVGLIGELDAALAAREEGE